MITFNCFSYFSFYVLKHGDYVDALEALEMNMESIDALDALEMNMEIILMLKMHFNT